MAEQDWLRPQVPVEVRGTAWTSRPAANFELRPLSLGEILDRTFALYRSHFWLFAGISMIAATVNVVGQAISLSVIGQMAHHMVLTPAPGRNPAAAIFNSPGWRTATAGSYLVGFVFLLVSAITQAATAFAMAEVYQHRPVTVQEALGRVLPRWYRWIGIAIWQGFSLLWIPVIALTIALILFAFGAKGSNIGLSVVGGVLLAVAVLGGLPAGVVLYLRNALAVPAAVTEGLAIAPAMRRSKNLAAGAKGRTFVVLLIAFCLLEVVGVLQAPVGMLMMLAPNRQHYFAEAVSLLLTFAGHTVVAPVALVGLTLVYFDQRVRKEAFDLEVLLNQTHAGGHRPASEQSATDAPMDGPSDHHAS